MENKNLFYTRHSSRSSSWLYLKLKRILSPGDVEDFIRKELNEAAEAIVGKDLFQLGGKLTSWMISKSNTFLRYEFAELAAANINLWSKTMYLYKADHPDPLIVVTRLAKGRTFEKAIPVPIISKSNGRAKKHPVKKYKSIDKGRNSTNSSIVTESSTSSFKQSTSSEYNVKTNHSNNSSCGSAEKGSTKEPFNEGQSSRKLYSRTSGKQFSKTLLDQLREAELQVEHLTKFFEERKKRNHGSTFGEAPELFKETLVEKNKRFGTFKQLLKRPALRSQKCQGLLID
eukprot:TRINITY_DN4626_c0_g1_i16.p1 TRINITY_DN4626_c0_g1~~TRINITY_DN4626_c0_g1_i16.p1  ORF type:complete len:321 (-),score=-3.42 TRINITY_DN4626_c0_g1_i16:31-888(-)